MIRYINGFYADPFRLVHEDPPVEDPPIDDPPVDPPVTDPKKGKAKVVFSPEQQAYVNSILAEEKRKSQAASNKLVTELETIRNSSSTTAAEKEALEIRIEEIKSQHLTAEELRKKDEKKAREKWQKEAETSKAEAERWKGLYTESTIHRSIVDAATVKEHKAHNPQHIVSILAGKTRLVEELDDEGKPTGNLIPKVKLTTTKDGKPATLEMAVTEAVKFLSEQDDHASLFDSGAVGGLGGHSNDPRRKGGDSGAPPTDPAEYRKWREKNRDKVGAPPIKATK